MTRDAGASARTREEVAGDKPSPLEGALRAIPGGLIEEVNPDDALDAIMGRDARAGVEPDGACDRMIGASARNRGELAGDEESVFGGLLRAIPGDPIGELSLEGVSDVIAGRETWASTRAEGVCERVAGVSARCRGGVPSDDEASPPGGALRRVPSEPAAEWNGFSPTGTGFRAVRVADSILLGSMPRFMGWPPGPAM